MAKVAATPRMTVAEFLDWESGDHLSWELEDGVPVALAAPAAFHRRIVANLARLLGNCVEGDECVVETEVGIVPVASAHVFHQADLAVTCAPSVGNERLMAEPLIVVEVLSASTEDKDRKVKLPDYRTLESVAVVLLVDSERMYCELHRRFGDEGWLVDLLRRPEDELEIAVVGFRELLSRIYANVSLRA